jgi:hypothetical protein
MLCPFCGCETSPGSVRVGGLGLYPLTCNIVWDSDDGRQRRVRLTAGRQRMPGRGCRACGAVVLDPPADPG